MPDGTRQVIELFSQGESLGTVVISGPEKWPRGAPEVIEWRGKVFLRRPGLGMPTYDRTAAPLRLVGDWPLLALVEDPPLEAHGGGSSPGTLAPESGQ